MATGHFKMKRKWNDEIAENGEDEKQFAKKADIFEVVRTKSTLELIELQNIGDYLEIIKDDEKKREFVKDSANFQVLSNLLVTYKATRSEPDQTIYGILKLLEKYGVDLSTLHPLVFGANARENYDDLRKLGTNLHVRVAPNEVLTKFLSPQMLWQTVKNHAKESSKNDDQCYDVEFVLCLLISILHPGSSLSCQLFISRNGLSLLFSCTSSSQRNIRALAYCALQKYLNLIQEIKIEDFPERSLVIYLIRLFKQSLDQPAQRISNIISHFFARVAKLVLHSENDVYPQIMAFLCMKPVFDVKNVPEFFKLFFSSSPKHHVEERDWVLTLIAEAMIEPIDYSLLQNKAGVKLMLGMFSSCCLNQSARRQILSTLKACASMPSVAHDLFSREALHTWIVIAISNKSLTHWERNFLAQIFCLLVENERKYQRGSKGKTLMCNVSRTVVGICGTAISGTLREITNNESFAAECEKARESISRMEKIMEKKWKKKKKYQL